MIYLTRMKSAYQQAILHNLPLFFTIDIYLSLIKQTVINIDKPSTSVLSKHLKNCASDNVTKC